MSVSARTVATSAADVNTRAKHARGFIAAAELVREFGSDAGISPTSNIVGSLAILAGIAASDAICGKALGKRAGGEAHDDAIRLLASATLDGPAYSRDLRRLLSVKTNVQYSTVVLSDAAARDQLKWAKRLVAGMERLLI